MEQEKADTADLYDAASLIPTCSTCQTRPETVPAIARVSRALHSWELLDTSPADVSAGVEAALPHCSACLERFDPKKVYERVISLMRRRAMKGGAPREIQDVLDAAAKQLGIEPKRWI